MNLTSDKRSVKLVESVVSWYTPAKMRWHYEHGLMVLSALEVAKEHGIPEFNSWAYSMYDPFIEEGGAIKTYRLGEYNLDQINAGRVLFPLYTQTKEERFLLAANLLKSQLNSQPRTFNGVYWHKELYPWQIWLDGLYMQGPFNAQFCQITGDSLGFDDIVQQLVVTYETLGDRKTGLLYHAWDESRGQRWSDETTGLSPHFWGRAIGWYLMACIDVLDFLPPSHPRIGEIHKIIKAVLQNLLGYQSEGGMWYQVIDLAGREGNYLETSATAMFTYTILKALRLSIIEGETWQASAEKAIEDIFLNYLRVDEAGHWHIGGICSVAGLGGNPYRNGTFPYYVQEPVFEDDFKGVGPLVLALLELERMKK